MKNIVIIWSLACVAGPAAAATSAPGQAALALPGTLIVLNKSDASASLIRLADGGVRATLATGAYPHEVAVSPDGRTAVVTNYGNRDAPGNTLTVIDLAAARVARSVDLGEYAYPHGIEFLPDGRRVAVTAESRQAVLVVDTASGRIAQALHTGQDLSHMLALAPDGATAYVSNIRSGSVTRLDLAGRTPALSRPAGGGTEGIALAPRGGALWITNRDEDSVLVLDPHTLAERVRLDSTGFPIRVRFTPDGGLAMVSNARAGSVRVFDVPRATRRFDIPLPELAAADDQGRMFAGRFGASPVPIGLLAHPDGRHAFVAASRADCVYVLDLERGAVVGRLATGREPDGLGYSPVE